MMIEVPSYRGGASPTPVLFLLLILLLLGFPVRCGAGGVFPGDTPAGGERGPPAVAARMWAWMVKGDILRLRVVDLFYDADGLSGALWRFGPALMGCAAWFLSFLSAAACWFAVWTSIALFLRARPSLESDIPRVLWFPLRDYWFPLTSIILFLLPLVAGLGLVVVTCSWMMFSIAYLRRGEMVLMTTAILLLAVFFFGGSTLHLIREMTGNTPREGWLGADGCFPQSWTPG